MTKIGIIGHKGRMGGALVEAILEAGADHAGGVDQGDDVAALVAVSDILVDFSAPAALEATLDACVAAGKAIVIGTTGLEERHHFLIDNASKDIAVLQTGNTSLGINMLAYLVGQAAARLGDDWDIEITEMHHRHKVDAPSGTAQQQRRAALIWRRTASEAETALPAHAKSAQSALPACGAAASQAITASSSPAKAKA